MLTQRDRRPRRASRARTRLLWLACLLLSVASATGAQARDLGDIQDRPVTAPASARYHGTATYYGNPAPINMLVSVHLGDQVLATASVFDMAGQRVYDLQVPADDPDTPQREGAVAPERGVI